jgi:hypothetical protein
LTDIAQVRAQLLAAAGGYLRNPVRAPGVTCEVCTTPAEGYRHCWPCAQARTHDGTADLVVPLIYAIGGTQSGMLLRHYKDDPVAAVRDRHTSVLRRLLYLGLIRHEPCIARTVGLPIACRVTVPSLRARPGTHPFAALAVALNAVPPQPALIAAAPGSAPRTVSADHFRVIDRVTGEHVLVLDDTWTTGARAQSAALALRRAGAAAITVVILARWLAPEFGRNADFISTRLRRDYDPDLCPVTGGPCPS